MIQFAVVALNRLQQDLVRQASVQALEIVKYLFADTAESTCGRSLAWSRT